MVFNASLLLSWEVFVTGFADVDGIECFAIEMPSVTQNFVLVDFLTIIITTLIAIKYNRISA